MMYGGQPSHDEEERVEQEVLEENEGNYKPKNKKKFMVKVGAFVIAGSIAGSIVAWNYLNGNVKVNASLDEIIALQSDETILDEKLANEEALNIERINELERYVTVSSRLAEMDLGTICAGMRPLNKDEVQEVSAYTISDIEAMLDSIEKLDMANFNDELTKDAILRKLSRVEVVVNDYLQSEGSSILEEYGKLLIKVCATDACNLDVEHVDAFGFADDAFKQEDETDIGLYYVDQVTGKDYDFTIARSCHALNDAIKNITSLKNFQSETEVSYNKDYNDLVLDTINLFKLIVGNDFTADSRKIKAEYNNREVAENIQQLLLKPTEN